MMIQLVCNEINKNLSFKTNHVIIFKEIMLQITVRSLKILEAIIHLNIPLTCSAQPVQSNCQIKTHE